MTQCMRQLLFWLRALNLHHSGSGLSFSCLPRFLSGLSQVSLRSLLVLLVLLDPKILRLVIFVNVLNMHDFLIYVEHFVCQYNPTIPPCNKILIFSILLFWHRKDFDLFRTMIPKPILKEPHSCYSHGWRSTTYQSPRLRESFSILSIRVWSWVSPSPQNVAAGWQRLGSC